MVMNDLEISFKRNSRCYNGKAVFKVLEPNNEHAIVSVEADLFDCSVIVDLLRRIVNDHIGCYVIIEPVSVNELEIF